jgi:anaerobic selenocysteine-containing dehydrogenase
MSNNISRRNFLKLTGVGAAAAAALTGCGPAARYVTRRPYYEMPEYSKVGTSTYYATTCRECPAGCGIIVRTMEGRAIKAEGNPNHPVSQGKICSRGLTAVQGLYNPDRVTAPLRRPQRGQVESEAITWEDGVNVVAGTLQNGGGTAFLLGLTPDHLYNLASELSDAGGGPAPLRYGVTGLLEGRATLMTAVQNLFGEPGLPYFDIANADVVFSFGGDFLSTWLSPVSYGRAYGQFRRFSSSKPRGHLVSFEPRMGVTSGAADEWVPVAPGTEGLVAQVIGQLAGVGGEAGRVDMAEAARVTGVSEERFARLAEMYANAQAPLAIPGGSALSHANGLAVAESILSLNQGRMGQAGGMSVAPAQAMASSLSEVQELIQQMNAGQIQALFIHGVNPVFELRPRWASPRRWPTCRW